MQLGQQPRSWMRSQSSRFEMALTGTGVSLLPENRSHGKACWDEIRTKGGCTRTPYTRHTHYTQLFRRQKQSLLMIRTMEWSSFNGRIRGWTIDHVICNSDFCADKDIWVFSIPTLLKRFVKIYWRTKQKYSTHTHLTNINQIWTGISLLKVLPHNHCSSINLLVVLFSSSVWHTDLSVMMIAQTKTFEK